jgi:hypothetical protein
MLIDQLPLHFIPVPFLGSTDLETFVLNKNGVQSGRQGRTAVCCEFAWVLAEKHQGGAYDFSLLAIFRKTVRELGGGGTRLGALNAQDLHPRRQGGSGNA